MHRSLRPLVVSLLSLAFAAGCASTFRYRAVQSDFMAAAQADNEASIDPFAESTAVASYGGIVAELTPQQIASLDPKLQGNAWMIRSYAQWRSGQYQEAIASADAGMKVAQGPRDRVLLTLLPALAVDSELNVAWKQHGRPPVLSASDYATFQQRFTSAWQQVEAARGLIDPTTSQATAYYLAYQRWRIVNDWRIVIASVEREDVQSQARRDARAAAEHVVGERLETVAQSTRDSIPAASPLRQLIAAQGG